MESSHKLPASSSSRRHIRSLTGPHHLSLSPLSTTIEGMTDFTSSTHTHVSYIEGKSAPTTPRLLSRSSSRVNVTRLGMTEGLSKSKSTASITSPRGLRSGATTPRSRASRGPREIDHSDSDWLQRAGAVISSEARESKGQSWLASRASSTSLTAQDDDTDEEQTDAWEQHRGSRKHSRRGSMADDEFSPITTRFSFGPGSRPLSRYNSRPQSRKGSRAHILITPTGEREREGYFDIQEEFVAEPDFVDVDEEYHADPGAEDDVLIRRLVRRNTFGLGGVFETILGWSLFSLNEDGEESDNNTETGDDQGNDSEVSIKSHLTRSWEHSSTDSASDIRVPPPGEQSEGWQDAAWLLSVASKVLL